MLNLYPQIATKPADLGEDCDESLHEKNMEVIEKFIKNDATVVAAWGNLITKRRYLFDCLVDITKRLKDGQVN